MKLSDSILCAVGTTCVLFLLLFILPAKIVNASIYRCDNPDTPEIDQCVTECDDAGDCNCQQSSACIDGACSCTEDGVGGWESEYCGDCEDGYMGCRLPGVLVHEIRWCGGGSGPIICAAPGAVQEYPISCDAGPGSFNSLNGFVYKQA